MKIINRITVFLISVLSVSSFAEISEYQSMFLDDNGLAIKLEDTGDIPKFSADGRYVVYGEKKRSSEPTLARYHRHDTLTNETLSSPFFISDQGYQTSIPFPITSNGSVVLFHYVGEDEAFESGFQYSYNFNSGVFTKLEYTKKMSGMSEDGHYQLNYANTNGGREYFLLDMTTATELMLPEFDDVHYQVSNNGEVIVESGDEYLKYDVINDTRYSLSQLGHDKEGLNYYVSNAGWLSVKQFSDNGRYFSSHLNDGSVFLMDTVDDKVFKINNTNILNLVFDVNNEGVVIKIDSASGNTGAIGIYDIVADEVLFELICTDSTANCSENSINPYVINNDISKVLGTRSFEEDDIKYISWFIASVTPANNGPVEISILPESQTIDPYQDDTSQFSIEVSGTDIYGLDVSCNLSSSSLSLTQANYDILFGSQNSMTLPLIYDVTSVMGTETLVAPELPFSGAGSFVLADVIAEFTTEDIQINCAAEVSDERGQLLQVTLTPATIRIDDGVHGGTGSVSGVIEIPGVTDLSGVEVVLTIDGRQVTVITDENGRFEFDGLRDGDFTISLASENYVQSCQVANVTEGGAVDLGSIELLAGDINADGSIDIADFTFMAARYRSNQGDADYDVRADLNKDGTINIQDLAILGSHFGSTQCNPIP
jgi:hypothetical protein